MIIQKISYKDTTLPVGFESEVFIPIVYTVTMVTIVDGDAEGHDEDHRRGDDKHGQQTTRGHEFTAGVRLGQAQHLHLRWFCIIPRHSSPTIYNTTCICENLMFACIKGSPTWLFFK